MLADESCNIGFYCQVSKVTFSSHQKDDEMSSWENVCICDPVQQKGHLVGQVYSEIMSKTVCKIMGIKGNSHFVNLVFSKLSLQFL